MLGEGGQRGKIGTTVITLSIKQFLKKVLSLAPFLGGKEEDSN